MSKFPYQVHLGLSPESMELVTGKHGNGSELGADLSVVVDNHTAYLQGSSYRPSRPGGTISASLTGRGVHLGHRNCARCLETQGRLP